MFMIITVIITITYCNLLKLAQNEYERAKNVIGAIISTFRRRQKGQEEDIDQLSYQTEVVASSLEKVKNNLQKMNNQLQNIVENSESTIPNYNEIIDRIDLLQKELNIISKKQQNFQKELITIGQKPISTLKEDELDIINGAPTFTKLTDTERLVLKYLMDKGAMPSSLVEERIGKTREHTARLLKKLWQEGYVERETHRIPYIYRVTDNLQRMMLKEFKETV
jgi:DNA-binding MarR family transcriptional regulator